MTTATKVTCLQAGAVDDLHVDGQLATVIVEDNDTDGTTARLESLVKTSPKVGLVNDWDGLLDITLMYVSIVYVYCLLWGLAYGLGHGNDSSISKVKDAVLLEDWAEHGLHGDRWRWARDEGGVLVELLGEQVNTEEAVLAGSLAGGDLDDLAWATLEDDNVTVADMVGWDGDGVWVAAGGGGRGGGVDADVDGWGGVVGAVDHAVSGLVESMAEGVVVSCEGC